jgi:predicted dehydrogenase
MRQVRLGVIGAGWWSTVNHIPILQKRKDVDLVAVCRLGRDKLKAIQERFHFRFATEDYRDVLEQNLDGVIVSSPHYLHYEHARAALARGLHVMCEKPMTLSAREAWELVHLAAERNLHLVVPYGWHYKPFIQQAKAVVEEGLVGKIEYVLCHMASPIKDLLTGKGVVPKSQQPTIVSPDPATWTEKARGGGFAHGQVTHSSALMFWLTGLRARQVAGRMTSPGARVDLYDAATVEFQQGALGVISGAATLCRDDPFQVDIRIFGDRGVLLLDAEAGRERAVLRRHDGAHRVIAAAKGEGAYTCEGPPNRFVDLIQGRGTNDSPGEVAARSVELVEAMVRSATNNGKRVTIRDWEMTKRRKVNPSGRSI